MVELLYQNDEKWKNIQILDTPYTLGSHGCLITASANVKNLHENKIIENPETLYNKLVQNNGITKNGLVIWDVLSKILGCKINYFYTGELDYNINSYYVVHYYLKDEKGNSYGHFTNLIECENSNYFCFDVYNRINKLKKRNEIDRYVKYLF